MTKYLTTYQDLIFNIGKEVKFFDKKANRIYQGVLIKREDNITITAYGYILGTIEEKINEEYFDKIELIEEDNQETIENEHLNTWEKFYNVKQPADNINHPSHYQGKIECIDYLQDKLTAEEFKGFLKGNVLKYLSRAGKKDDELEDYKKAQWYMNKLIEKMEK